MLWQRLINGWIYQVMIYWVLCSKSRTKWTRAKIWFFPPIFFQEKASILEELQSYPIPGERISSCFVLQNMDMLQVLMCHFYQSQFSLQMCSENSVKTQIIDKDDEPGYWYHNNKQQTVRGTAPNTVCQAPLLENRKGCFGYPRV